MSYWVLSEEICVGMNIWVAKCTHLKKKKTKLIPNVKFQIVFWILVLKIECCLNTDLFIGMYFMKHMCA